MRDVTKQNKIHRVPMIFRFIKIKKKTINVFGDLILVSKRRQRVEGLCIVKLKLKVKKKIKKKKKQSRARNGKFSYWIRYHPSIYFTKKSKNARMGSGKGKYVRQASNVLYNQSFVEFRYIQKHWVLLFQKYLLSKYGIHLFVKKTKTQIPTTLLNNYIDLNFICSF